MPSQINDRDKSRYKDTIDILEGAIAQEKQSRAKREELPSIVATSPKPEVRNKGVERLFAGLGIGQGGKET